MPELYVLTGRSTKSPSSLKRMMGSSLSSISSSLIPRIEHARWMLSRPENSGWKPAPSSINDVTRPFTCTSPCVGSVTPDRSFKSVDLPAPFAPMIPIVEPFATSR